MRTENNRFIQCVVLVSGSFYSLRGTPGPVKLWQHRFSTFRRLGGLATIKRNLRAQGGPDTIAEAPGASDLHSTNRWTRVSPTNPRRTAEKSGRQHRRDPPDQENGRGPLKRTEMADYRETLGSSSLLRWRRHN